MNEETLKEIKKALEPRPDIIMVYCARCGLFIEVKLGQGVSEKSHGLCQECSANLRKELSNANK